MFKPIVITIAAVLGFLAFCVNCIAQTALDPTQGGAYPAYPSYLGVSCGGVHLAVREERTNDDGTVDAMVQATTRCGGSGRGARVRAYLACWDVTFASDRYAINNRARVLYATWMSGTTGYVCPTLE